MLAFESFILAEMYVNDGVKLTAKEELVFTREFNQKYGRSFLTDITVKYDSDDDGNDLYIGFKDTAHFKARMTQRHPDISPKEIKRVIKNCALGAFRSRDGKFSINHKFSLLAYSKSKQVGIYFQFEQGDSARVPYNFVLITVLPKGEHEISRKTDVKLMVEGIEIVPEVIFVD